MHIIIIHNYYVKEMGLYLACIEVTAIIPTKIQTYCIYFVRGSHSVLCIILTAWEEPGDGVVTFS